MQAQLAVEATGAAQRGIEGIGAGGRADDHYLATCAQAIHQREQLAADALFHLAEDLGALGGNGVDLVEEDDAWRGSLRFNEDTTQLGLALAVPLVDDLRPADAIELGAALGGHGAGDQRLAGSRRAVE